MLTLKRRFTPDVWEAALHIVFVCLQAMRTSAAHSNQSHLVLSVIFLLTNTKYATKVILFYSAVSFGSTELYRLFQITVLIFTPATLQFVLSRSIVFGHNDQNAPPIAKRSSGAEGLFASA